MAENIRTVMIFEMLGRPPEHLKQSMEHFIGQVSNEKGVEVLNKNIGEPKKIEKSEQELFTSFAELEINFDNLNSLLKILFVYMPSHIEIVYPQELRMKNTDISTLTNELVRKLHQYDEITKRLTMEVRILQNQIYHLKTGQTVEEAAAAQEKAKKEGKEEKEDNLSSLEKKTSLTKEETKAEEETKREHKKEHKKKTKSKKSKSTKKKGKKKD